MSNENVKNTAGSIESGLDIPRRKLVTAIGAGTAVSIPESWVMPIVKSTMLPAHGAGTCSPPLTFDDISFDCSETTIDLLMTFVVDDSDPRCPKLVPYIDTEPEDVELINTIRLTYGAIYSPDTVSLWIYGGSLGIGEAIAESTFGGNCADPDVGSQSFTDEPFEALSGAPWVFSATVQTSSGGNPSATAVTITDIHVEPA